MSCIRFNTPAQRQAMKDHRPTMVPGDAAAPLSPTVPPVTASKILRLRLLAADANPKIRESAASSPNTPADVLDALSLDTDDGVRSCVARNEITPCDLLSRLAHDDSERVRGFVALNFFVPNETMHRLQADPSEVVRGLVSWKMSLANA